MDLASQDGTPVMRPLLYNFPKDQRVYEIGDQYMFGPDLMVAPVVEKEASSRKVYFPEGAVWTDARNKKNYQGGAAYEIETPIDVIPLYYKDGADLKLFDLR